MGIDDSIKGHGCEGTIADGELCKAPCDLIEKNRILKSQYKIAQIAVEDWRSLDTALQTIIDLILQGFERPEKMAAAIKLDEHAYTTPEFDSSRHRWGCDIVVQSEVIGRIEIGFLETEEVSPRSRPMCSTSHKGLVETAARKVAFIIERRQAEKKKQKLEEQLRHADRLATIGQLAAGIAHELNNPLGDILGFAQLASNHQDLPEQTYQDLNRIVKSTLYAREVIKKILLFSRQSHPHEGKVNLNRIIEEWEDFINSRCVKNNIEMVLELDHELPDILADASQINQVIINLVVNAIHAMPDGGILRITTATEKDTVYLEVADSGTGIEEDVRDKVFLPFFTTKEVDQGTGLGLSVVYGIVKEHGASISLYSQVGEGSRFKIEFRKSA